ncbi:MAG: hypothetical protein OEQ14_18650, partial [Gammaproteobacteria bacterium]|nr:hypothetical protein [Gammaproteobacteria bacterium]
RQHGQERADRAGKRFDDIRPELDELSHTTDRYSLTVRYEKGPYSAVIAVLELNEIDGTWVAAWQVGTTVGDAVHDWEVAYNPRGVDVQREWFTNSDDLFRYLTTSIAERIVEMEADDG